MRTTFYLVGLLLTATALLGAAPTASADVCLSPVTNHACGACPSNDDLHVHVDTAGPDLLCASVLGIDI